MTTTTSADFEAFFRAYVDCALWSSTDASTPAGGYPMDESYGPDDIAGETIATMRADCADFWDGCGSDLAGLNPGQCGHDFWLTRNRHGAGFWDRGLGNLGHRLAAMSHPYGEFSLYVGDDGLVYGS